METNSYDWTPTQSTEVLLSDATIQALMNVIYIFILLIIFAFFINCCFKFVKNLTKQCANCNKTIRYLDGKKHQKQFYCLKCYKKNFNVCDICEKVSSKKLKKYHKKEVCEICLNKKIIRCERCNDSYGKWEMKRIHGKYYCNPCYDDYYRYFEVININQTKLVPTTFKENPFERYCGVEIECRNRDRDRNCFIKNELKDLKFSQCRDASINTGGVEFISKPMNGDNLFNKISTFCKILVTKKYFVDRSCGLHIHLEVPKKVNYLKKIYLFYEKFEPLLFKMVPKSRQKTDYCKKFKTYYQNGIETIFKIKNLNEFKSMVYETKEKNKIKSITSSKSYDKRYCWINFHSIFYRGTLEIRNHSGTIINKKINNWFLLHLTILDYLKKIDLETIARLKVNKETFLSIFPKDLKKYIQERWDKFENGYMEEKI